MNRRALEYTDHNRLPTTTSGRRRKGVSISIRDSESSEADARSAGAPAHPHSSPARRRRAMFSLHSHSTCLRCALASSPATGQHDHNCLSTERRGRCTPPACEGVACGPDAGRGCVCGSGKLAHPRLHVRARLRPWGACAPPPRRIDAGGRRAYAQRVCLLCWSVLVPLGRRNQADVAPLARCACGSDFKTSSEPIMSKNIKINVIHNTNKSVSVINVL